MGGTYHPRSRWGVPHPRYQVGRYPIPGLGGVGTPSQVQVGGYPIQVQVGGTPSYVQGVGGTPPQVQVGGYPIAEYMLGGGRYARPRSGWRGYPIPGPVLGVPHPGPGRRVPILTVHWGEKVPHPRVHCVCSLGIYHPGPGGGSTHAQVHVVGGVLQPRS